MAKDALYREIYKEIKQNILEGKYENDLLPTELELTEMYYTSRITIRNVMKLLTEDDLIKRIPGRGTFINTASKEKLQNKPYKIGLILSNVSESFGLGILLAIENEANKNNYELVFKNSQGDSKKELACIDDLIDYGCDGIIIQPVHNEYYNEKIIYHFYRDYPMVLLDRDFSGIPIPCVRTNNYEASYHMTKFLLEHHAKTISFFCGKNIVSSIDERKNGYLNAFFQSSNVITDESLANFLEIPNQSYTEERWEGDLNRIIEFLEKHPNIDTLYASEFSICRLLYEATRKMGKKIPEDYNLVTFDYQENLLDLDFTRIMQDQKQMGIQALELLIANIKKETVPNKVFTPFYLHEGNTVKN